MVAGRIAVVSAAVVAGTLMAAGPTAAAPRLANHCFAIAFQDRFVKVGRARAYRATAAGRDRAARFHLKPTGLGRYMLYDRGGRLMTVAPGGRVVHGTRPGPSAEWRVRRGELRSTA
ncbi:MAG TPA: hypothetical protein VJT75_19355, partial [Thermoleophilaceae bacterium]|nr:hypothetical protein [Thermoleophilaceae bacterium]